MAKINVTPEEFGDVVISFLLDKILHPDDVIYNNKEFDKLVLRMGDKGMKTIFMKYYYGMDSNLRVKYKRIKDIFEGTKDSMYTINITSKKGKEKKEPKKKESLSGKILKKLIKGGIK